MCTCGFLCIGESTWALPSGQSQQISLYISFLFVTLVFVMKYKPLEPGQLAAVAGRPRSSIEVASFAWADLGALE